MAEDAVSSMRIGLDMDEVLAALVFDEKTKVGPLLRFHNERYGTSLSYDDVHSFNLWEIWGGTKDGAVRKIHEFYESPHFNQVVPMPQSQESVDMLHGRNDLVVVTSRPKIIAEKTMRWLHHYFPKGFADVCITNMYSEGKQHKKTKAEACKELKLDVMVEDSFDFAAECAAVGTQVLLFDHTWNRRYQNLPPNMKRVHSWRDITNRLVHNAYVVPRPSGLANVPA